MAGEGKGGLGCFASPSAPRMLVMLPDVVVLPDVGFQPLVLKNTTQVWKSVFLLFLTGGRWQE